MTIASASPWSSGFPDSLMFPVLLDLLVQGAPDAVHGDGGSLYLRLLVPQSQLEPPCPGCPAGEGNECTRVYLVATTRDHARVELGRTSYCANPHEYVTAGSGVESLLGRVLLALHERLKLEIERALARSGDAARATGSADRLFRDLFCPRVGGRGNPHPPYPSVITGAILEALHGSAVDDDATIEDPFADAALSYLEAAPDRSSSDMDRKEDSTADNPDLRMSMSTLLRYCHALVSTNPPDAQYTTAIHGLVWELFRCHAALSECYLSYREGLRWVRVNHPRLGLSGWCAASGVPLNLQNIENPFEIRAHIELRRKQTSKPDLPVPAWGDRARGHQDRLEREGRPFLVVPIPDPNHPDGETLGFLRVATKREEERRFTDADEEALKEYARQTGLVVAPYLQETDAQLRAWWGIRLFGATRGQSIPELGKTAARAFLESYNATAATLFLREDLLQTAYDVARPSRRGSGRAEPPDGSAEATDLPDPEEPETPKAPKYPLYMRWGTAIDSAFLAKDPEHQRIWDTFRQNQHDRYYEGLGKTGSTIAGRAAVLAVYDSRDQVTVHLSREHSIVSFAGSGRATYKMPKGILGADPRQVDRLIQAFCTKAQTPNHQCEVDSSQHAAILIVPLIDPDSSPEPLGAVRLIFERHPAHHPAQPNGWKKMLSNVGLRARSFSRLIREALQDRRLIRGLAELVEYTTTDDHVRKDSLKSSWAAGGIHVAGPHGGAAASLLRPGEASAVSVFVRREFAPRQYQLGAPEPDSYVLVGSAGALDELSEEDRDHFRNTFCETYFEASPGKCHYSSGQGRTGQAISGTPSISAPGDGKSEFICEVRSPNALMTVPVMALTDSLSDQDSSAPDVVALVRFVRTEERRRARFLAWEQERLMGMVQILARLIPARDRQDVYSEFLQRWASDRDRVFPPRLLEMLSESIFAAEGQSIEKHATRVPSWLGLEDGSESTREVPSSCDGKSVRDGERAILAWFLQMVERPAPDAKLTELVGQVLRALLRIHWGSECAKPWVDKLDRLDRFEAALSELPRYRDHSVHQFQVFLLGWILVDQLSRARLLNVWYPGWTGARSDAPRDSTPLAEGSAPLNASSWVLASVFHDVAYPLQKMEHWANAFCTTLIGTPSAVIDIKRPSATLARNGGENAGGDEGDVAGTQFARDQEVLLRALSAMVRGARGESPADVETLVREAVKGCVAGWDHGAWGAFTLLDGSDCSAGISDAAAAIAAHAGFLEDAVEHSLLVGDLTASQPNDPGSAARALAFVLIVSDALHEWGRTFRDKTSPDASGEQMGRRPAMSFLKIERGDRGKLRVEVGISLGDCGGDHRDQKLRELEALRQVLRSDVVQVAVTVGYMDITKLSANATESYRVVIGKA